VTGRQAAADLRLLSLGAGVQSTTLALMAAQGRFAPGLDGAIFADTGWEPPAVYAHLDRLAKELADADIPLYRVSAGNLRADALDPAHRYVSMPLYVRLPDGKAVMQRRQCTNEYKIRPIRRKIREMLGAGPPAYRVPGRPGSRVAELWVGFSTDEIFRVTDQAPRYLRMRHPLIELDMDRKACQRWLRLRGWDVVKSACVGCPYHGNRHWRTLRDHDPAGWADVTEFDAAVRDGGGSAWLRGHAYLHRSMVPLAQADVSRVTRGEWRARQGDLLDLIADEDAEREYEEEEGVPGGCSPFSCHGSAPP
jgi:hypothetical protein